MWYILLVLVTGTKAGHMAYNTSDVITTYSGHADAVPVPDFKGTEVRNTRKEGAKVEERDRIGERKGDKLKSEGKRGEAKAEAKGEVVEGADSDYLEAKPGTTEADDGIVFVPSGNNDVMSFSRRLGGRQDEYVAKNKFSVNDMVERVAIGDVINERLRVETEPPNADGVVFKPGKNNEQTEDKIKHEMDDQRIEDAVKEYKEIYENPMDCENLDCENVVESVCGVKIQNKKPKYRLFMNECFFRKVNCGLKYDYNRYRTVPLEDCNGVGSHTPRGEEKPAWIRYYPPKPLPAKSVSKQSNARRSEPSRRVMTANANGLPCEHYCPARCPDSYAPVCAYAFPKQARVFQNHCMLDLQSCSDGSVWQERALAECAGAVRAEVHERAAFIGWMQRVGVLDKKGHLVM